MTERTENYIIDLQNRDQMIGELLWRARTSKIGDIELTDLRHREKVQLAANVLLKEGDKVRCLKASASMTPQRAVDILTQANLAKPGDILYYAFNKEDPS